MDTSAIDAIVLPKPIGNFLLYKVVGDIVYLSGQTCSRDGQMKYQGRVGADLSIDEGYAAARVCMENLFAALRQSVNGDWSRVKECVRLTGYINSEAPFAKTPLVMNGASDLVIEMMGESGRHARSAVGVSALPGNAAVEVEAIFRIAN